MTHYTITEPHPSVAQNSYIHAGRGGAGNFMRAPLTTAPSGVPTPLAPTSAASSTSSASRGFFSGRGGAGNAHSALERPVLSFEDEFQRLSAASSGHGHFGGRGGAGNFASGGVFVVPGGAGGAKPRSSSESSTASNASSGGEGWKKRLSGVMRR